MTEVKTEAEPKPQRADFHVHFDPSDPETGRARIDEALQNNVTLLGLLAKSEIPEPQVFTNLIRYGEKLGVIVVPGMENHVIVKVQKVGEETKEVGVDLIALGFRPDGPKMLGAFGPGQESVIKNRNSAQRQRRFMEEQGFSFESQETWKNGSGREDEEARDMFNKVMEGREVEKAIHICNAAASNPVNDRLIEQLKNDKVTRIPPTEEGIDTYAEAWRYVEKTYGKSKRFEDPARLTGKLLWYVFFAFGRPGQIVQGGSKQPLMPASEMIDVVHRAGGLVFYSPEGNFYTKQGDINPAVPILLTEGIDGIMAIHSKKLRDEMNPKDLKRLWREYPNLIFAGGSDARGEEFQVGTGDPENPMYLRAKKGLLGLFKRTTRQVSG